MRKTLINDSFQCKVLDYSQNYLDIKTGQSDEGYEDVFIPHDALIGNVNEFYSDKVIWYRRKIGSVPGENSRQILYFEGVYMDASVYVNNSFVGRWVNGYTSFWFDVTEYVKSPEDYIYVSIDYRCPNSRWYAGPGINRNVWLYEMSDNHFTVDSLYVCPEFVGNETFELRASVDLGCVMSTASEYEVIFECKELGLHNPMTKNGDSQYTFNTCITSPKLWDTDAPYTYSCTVYLLMDDNIVDTADTEFGFRSVEMTTDRGLLLNGRHIKLNGICLHSDQGCLGTAFHPDMARRQLLLMKDMGVNAIRLTHNVQAPGFLDLCDELGLLVLNEAFDCWKLPKTEFDYARFFEEWSERDIRSWVMRDRNHPCIFLWSAGNEIYDTHAGEEGAKTLTYIANEIKKNDYYGLAPVALCSNYMAWDNTIKAVDNIKYAGYNYGEFLYEAHHQNHPDWIIFGSETASLVQSRGIYHFPLSKSLLVDDDEHCSSLGNCCTSWGAESMDKCVTTERDTPYSLGQFLWAGIDYLGEPTPYHTKNSYFGLADTATFPKDVYFMLQSCWKSFEEKPMIHLLPYWDFNDGQMIDVRVCSNAYEVELFFNETSLGRKIIDHEKGFSMYADYRLPYGEGTLRAIGYDKEGNGVLEAVEESFADTASLMLTITCYTDGKTSAISANSFDVSKEDRHLRFVEIQAVDISGKPVRNASDRINITLSGPAKLIGLCNGNQTDVDSFTGSSMRLFSGKLLAVIRPEGSEGTVTVNASIDRDDVPVRKLKIVTASQSPLTPENDCVTAHIQVLPANADYKSIEYQITNESGVPIQNAKITDVSEDGLTLTIKAVADANFNLRALCRETDNRVTVISCLEFVAEGFGELYKDPYQFVSASLFDESNVELGNGNEKGIATSRLEDTYILYRNIDFGPSGTKEITIPVFELGGNEVLINFWKGMPHGEHSVCLGKYSYHKPSIWNVYQEETYELNEIISGIEDFGIEVISDKIHIKGFIFKPYNDSYDEHIVRNATNIYGDQFTITDEMITGIGNNVCITYKDMDFGEDGATRITINGHTPLFQNTIHIRFNNGESELKQIIEFPQSEGIIEQTFDLEPIRGKGDMSFVFLPGSNFDFKKFIFSK